MFHSFDIKLKHRLRNKWNLKKPRGYLTGEKVEPYFILREQMLRCCVTCNLTNRGNRVH